MVKEIPSFRSDKEAANFWDRTDATEYMEGGKLRKFVWAAVENRCDQCGSEMKLKVANLKLHNGRVTVHKVKKYHCPFCHGKAFS